MSRYLITGAKGFLGSVIASYLNKNKEEFETIGRSAGNTYSCDLSFEVPKLIKQVDIVVHCAGKAHSVPRSLEEKKAFFDVNFEGTKNLCAAIDRLEVKPRAFVFISTVSVYGLDSGILINEEHPLNGSTPYAKSKILAEEWLLEWAESVNIKLSILRLPLIAGLNPPGNLGAMIKGISNGRYLSIGSATARKSMVWGEDIATIIPILAEIGGTYNLTDGHHPSFGELEVLISTGLGKKRPFSIPLIAGKLLGKIGDLIGDRSPINTDKINKITSTLTFDDAKARNILGWKPSSVIGRLSQTLK